MEFSFVRRKTVEMPTIPHWASPRLDLLVGQELPVRLRGSGRQQGQVHRGDGALVWRLGGFGTRHVGAHPSWTAGVQQDLRGDFSRAAFTLVIRLQPNTRRHKNKHHVEVVVFQSPRHSVSLWTGDEPGWWTTSGDESSTKRFVTNFLRINAGFKNKKA